MSELVGKTIGHYTILEEIGRGGMGVVYKARDTKLDRFVALKFLPHFLTSDEIERERFYHEARAAAALTHPNIGVIHEIADYDGQLFLVMEYVEGRTLKQPLTEGGTDLSTKKVLDIAIQVCEGLSAAHEKGIVHRDIKADNIMLTPKGQVKIMDFGLAKVKGSTKLTKAGSTLGTAAYMSPEQAQGEDIDQRSDIFSFGVVLYELLTSRLPFRGEHHSALLYSLLNEDPAPIARFNDRVPPELERSVMKALAKDRDERYQHIDDLLADLRRERKNIEYARSGYIRSAEAALARPEIPPAARRLRRFVIPAAALLAAVVAVIVFNPFNFQITTQKTIASEQNSLAVMYFQNIPDPDDKDHTGDMLADLLITSLSQTRGLEVISRERLFDIQKELKADARTISPGMATEIAKRAGVTTMLLGSILQTEPALAVTIRLIDVSSGRIINSERVTGLTMKQLYPLVDTLALLVRNDLSIAEASASEPVKSIAEVTTSSSEAYRSYTEGVELNNKFFTAEAQAAFRRAIELDSNFAMGYFGLATLNLPIDPEERRAALEKAWKLRDRVTERERLAIEAVHASVVGSDPIGAAAIDETILRKYPHEQAAYLGLTTSSMLAGEYDNALAAGLRGLKSDTLDKNMWNLVAYIYAGMNRRAESFSAIDRYLALAPGEPNPYDSKGELYLVFGDLDSATYWFQKAVSFRADFNSSVTLGHIALLRQDDASAEKYYQQFGSTSDRSQKARAELARLLIPLRRGRLNEVRHRMMQTLSTLQGQPSQAEKGDILHDLTMISYELSDDPAMLTYAKQYSTLLNDNPDDNIFGRDILAWAYECNGNHGAATKLLEQLNRDIHPAVVPDRAVYECATALLSFEKGDFALAASHFDKLAQQLMPNRAPQMLYGVSLLKSGRTTDAVRELRRVTSWAPISFPPLSNPFVPTSSLWPTASVKAHYWLGVAYEQLGKKDEAVQEYGKFLDIWKDADFQSREVQDARVRLGKLKGMPTG